MTMPYISRKAHCFVRGPFFWYFLFAALARMLRYTLWALLFPLPLDKERPPCSTAGFILGGSLHARNTQARSSCLHMLHVCWVIPDPCCMSARLSPDPNFFAALSGVFGGIAAYITSFCLALPLSRPHRKHPSPTPPHTISSGIKV